MGNKESKNILSFADWEKVQTVNGIDIFKNKRNNEIAQKRTVTIDPYFDLNDELKVYHLREFNNDSLVRSFGALQIEKKGNSTGICSGHKKVQVLTERITYRLSELPQLTFAQSLLFLRQSIRAYSKVFRSYGPIHITKKMIGINDFGEVRCWLNENWALNHPDHEFPTLQSTKMQGLSEVQYGGRSQVYDGKYRDETEMVHNILSLIEEKCEEGKFPTAFREEIEHHSTSFRKLTLYLQDFLSINEVFVPPKINYDTIFVSKLKMKQQDKSVTMTGGYLTNQNIIQSYSNQGGYNSRIGNIVLDTNLEKDRYDFFHHYSKSPQVPLANYTLTKTTTSNTFANQQGKKSRQTAIHSRPQQNNVSEIAFSDYQSFSYDIGKPLLSSNQQTYVPFQSFTVQKPIQNQSSYSSSYYQYSMTNPQPSKSYNQGTILTNTDLISKTQQIKPSSHTTLSNRLGSVSNNSNQSSYHFPTTYEVKNQPENINDYTKGFKNFYSAAENIVSYQPISEEGKNVKTFERFKSKYGNTENSYNPQQISYNFTQKFSKYEPSYSQSPQKSVAFSFDGKKDFNSKFNDFKSKAYETNFSTNYESSNKNANEATIQGKYLNQFNSLIGHSLLKDTYSSQNSSANPIVA